LPKRRRFIALIVLAAALAAASTAQADLKVVGVFGSPGSNPGQLGGPLDVTTDSAGNVYLANAANARVDKYTPDAPTCRASAVGAVSPASSAIRSAWRSRPAVRCGSATSTAAAGASRSSTSVMYALPAEFRTPGRSPSISPDGAFIAKFGTPVTTDGNFSSAYDVFAAPNNLADLEKFTSSDVFAFQANAKNTFQGTPGEGLQPVSVTAPRAPRSSPSGGAFTIKQTKSGKGLTELVLLGGKLASKNCSSKEAAARTAAKRGSVQVRDLVKRRDVLVKAGHSYLAAPRLKKKRHS
jgi:hypothetical protein